MSHAGKHLRWVLLLLCLAGVAPSARARATPEVAAQRQQSQPLPPDLSTALPPRRPDANQLRELAGQRDFRYEEPKASTDAWDAFWARVWKRLGRLLDHRIGNFPWRYVIYAVALGILVFAVLKLLQVDITGAFGRSAQRQPLAYDTATEDIHEVDFPARIAEAEAAGNFRLATRLGYLEVLKHLTDGGFIRWQPDKTNHAYLSELAAGPLREAFRSATWQFEYVWYGDLRLTSTLYHEARTGQRVVSSLLSGHRRGTLRATALPG